MTISKRCEILGRAGVRTTLVIYTHAMRRKHDDSADKMAELAWLTKCGNIVETLGLSRSSGSSRGASATVVQRATNGSKLRWCNAPDAVAETNGLQPDSNPGPVPTC